MDRISNQIFGPEEQRLITEAQAGIATVRSDGEKFVAALVVLATGGSQQELIEVLFRTPQAA